MFKINLCTEYEVKPKKTPKRFAQENVLRYSDFTEKKSIEEATEQQEDD